MKVARLAMLGGVLALLPGCEGTGQNQQIGAVVGAVAGGALGNVAGRGIGGRGSRTAGTVLGAGMGAALGGAFGRMLDERDRARAEAATIAALRQPLPPGFYRASYPTRPQSAPFTPAPSRGSFPSPAPAPRVAEPAPAAAPPSSSPAGRLPGVPRAPTQRWVSDHSGATGSATVLRATPAEAGRGECRTIQNIAQRGRQQETTTQEFCEATPGAADWQAI